MKLSTSSRTYRYEGKIGKIGFFDVCKDFPAFHDKRSVPQRVDAVYHMRADKQGAAGLPQVREHQLDLADSVGVKPYQRLIKDKNRSIFQQSPR